MMIVRSPGVFPRRYRAVVAVVFGVPLVEEDLPSSPGCSRGHGIGSTGATYAVLHQARGIIGRVTVSRSVLLFLLAAVAEIGGAWLVWQGVRDHRGLAWVGAGVVSLGLYGFVATLQPDPHFGRILAAYGGLFVAGSLARGVVMDGFRPDRFDGPGALICLIGVAVIMYAPRSA